MSIIRSAYAKGNRQAPYPQIAGCAIAHRFAMEVPTNVANGDILELAILPAHAEAMDIVVDSDDLDSNGAPAITFDVGIMSGAVGDEDAGRTCGDEFFSASNVGQAGGVERASKASAFRVGQSNVTRSIGVKITNVAATAQAGTIGLTLTVAAT